MTDSSRTATKRASTIPLTTVHKIEADGLQLFYRAAGPKDAPTILLLHGFPTSSFQFRELIPRLATDYRVIAPDLPGFGFTEGGTRWQYTYGVANPESVAPESYTLDTALLERPGNKEIQLDLFLDYANNIKLYPKFQEYFRTSKPPLLAIWGKNDPFFIPPGAEAFKKDIPNAKVQFLDTGHFAIETHVEEIAGAIKEFLAANGIVRS